jgi:glycosyltransferase involved in cell wall biosynthesis
MKILFMCKVLGMGGIEKNLVLLSRELIKLNHEVVVVASPGIIKEMLVKEGVKCVNFEFESIPGMPSAIKKMHFLINKERPDIVHSFSAVPTLVFKLSQITNFISSKIYKPIFLASIMGLQESPSESKLITYLRVYLTILGAKKVIVISPEIKRFLVNLRISTKRLVEQHIVGIEPHYGFKKNGVKGLKDKYNVETPYVVSTIGALTARKSHELFIEAANEIIKKRHDISFLIAGEGPDRDKLERQISKFKIEKYVKLIGVETNLLDLFTVTDLCVKPGVVEGFIGVTVLEAQITGTPVVAFYTEDVKLGIEDRETGLIATNSDILDLKNKVLEVLDNEKLSEKLSNQGQIFARETWAIDKIVKNLVVFYNNELKTHKQG